MDAATRVAGGAPHARHARLLRDHPARRHHPHPLEADAGGGLRPGRGPGLPPRVLPRAGADRARLRRPAQVPQAGRRPVRRGRAPARSSSTRRCSTSTSGPTCRSRNGVWDLGTAEAAELAKLAETTYRDVNIGLANQFARFAAAHGHRRLPGDRGQQLPAVQPHPPPGIAVGGHCIPVYPRLYLWNDPDATVVRAAREANAAMPEYTVGLLEGAHGDLAGAARGRARRRLPRRREGDGVLRRVRHRRGAARRAARTVSSTTRCTPTTSSPRWASRRSTWASQADAVVVQADHAASAEIDGGRRARACARWSTAAASPTRPAGRA